MSLNSQLTDVTSKKEHELEALRGFAALLVVMSHLIGYGKFIDPGFFPYKLTNIYDGGHEMVLIFLLLSGFVIAISTKAISSASYVKLYIKKRFVRIYPIYLLSLLVTLIIGTTKYQWLTILNNLVFTNVFFSDVMPGNGPIWSLHYEVIFYLLFIPVFYYKLDPVKIGCFAFILGLTLLLISPYTNIISPASYCFGFCFWISGVIIARYFVNKDSKPIDYVKLLSYLFLLISLPQLNVFPLILKAAGQFILGHPIEYTYDGNVNNWFKIAFSFSDFAYLPYCFIGILLFTNRKFRYKNAIILILQILPMYAVVNLVLVHKWHLSHFFVYIGSYGLSWILFFLKPIFLKKISIWCIKFLAWTGEISYGIYLFHIPMLILFNRLHFFSGSLFSFSVRVLLYLVLIYVIAYLVEKKYQIQVKKLLFKKRTPDPLLFSQEAR